MANLSLFRKSKQLIDHRISSFTAKHIYGQKPLSNPVIVNHSFVMIAFSLTISTHCDRVSKESNATTYRTRHATIFFFFLMAPKSQAGLIRPTDCEPLSSVSNLFHANDNGVYDE